MGITTYLFHRSNGLEKQKFNMFFLDMGENIHFHYRDLRIEFSVEEFKELAELFTVYAQAVLSKIEEGYQDGVLANTNEPGTLTTFWDKEKKLTFPVKYHEQHLAIEETKDGYHLHIRNYKILLHRDSFFHFVRAIAPIQSLIEGNTLRRDPVSLLQQNELAIKLVSRMQTDKQEKITIEVDSIYTRKAGQVLQAIGYLLESTRNGEHIYRKEQSTILLVPPGHADISHPSNDMDTTLNLPAFLALCGTTLCATELNQLKLKVLFLLKTAEEKKIPSFHLQDLYVNRGSLNPVIDLFNRSNDINMAEEQKRFNELLTSRKLFFVKPAKKIFSPDKLRQVEDAFFDFVMHKLAPHACVRKIYLLGSASNHRTGCYVVPFIHFDWAKLNSDFDIFVELDPDSAEGDIPGEWEKKFYWSRTGCDYYHFGDIGAGMSSAYARQFPGIRFYEHLVEGYLFHPATGDRGKKDKWFAEVHAHCIFSRDPVAEWVSQNYSINAQASEKFTVASFNRVYHIRSQAEEYVLKIYSSRYATKNQHDKISYEIGLLHVLKRSGLEVAVPICNTSGGYISKKGDERAVLFTMAPGKFVPNPGREEILLAGNLLARVHTQGKQYTTEYAATCGIKQPLLYWLDAWQTYHDQGGIVGTDLPLDMAPYKNILQNLSTFATHCHGDLSLINYLFHEGKCWLIDFQNIGYGPALIDLANGMVEFAAQKQYFLMENLDFFRQGYEDVRRLAEEEAINLHNLLIIQALVRQAKLLRLHYGGFGYELKEERILGLRHGLEQLLLQQKGAPSIPARHTLSP